LERLPGCAGIKVFLGSSTGSLLVEEPDVLRAILSRISRRSSYHCEDEARLRERKSLAEPGNPATHPIWRDEIAALISTERLVNMAEELKKPVHVLHVSTAEEMAFLRQRKGSGLVSVEVTPHHLTLAAPEAYERLGTRAQMNPPVRDAHHRDALWAALADGVADVIGSDHAPHTLEEKERPYPQSPSGMPGVQTLVPVMLNHVNEGRLSLERFVDLSSTAPARLFGAEKRGRIEVGFEAHFTVADLEAEREITNDWIASKCGWTPYDGMAVKGWPIATIIAGRVVMLDGAVMTEACGQPIIFAGQSPATSPTEGTSDGAPTPQ
jgi:dihydroorotase